MRFSRLSLLSLLLPSGALGLVPLLHEGDPKAIPNEYLVVYKKDIPETLLGAVEGLLAEVLGHVFAIETFKGVTATLTPTLLDVLRQKDDSVRFDLPL
jgi:hypothetical protein